MKLIDARRTTILKKARVVAGEAGMDREIRWVHIVDIPDVQSWVKPGQLLLTTGYAWPREEAQQRTLVRELASQNLAGIGLAVPRFFDRFPSAFCDEADRYGLPLLEIPWEIPFALITEELHTEILAEQSRLIEQSELIHRTLTRIALEANSLHDIAMALGELIQHSVTFEDQEGQVLGFYTIPDMEDAARHRTLEQGATPLDIMMKLETTGYLQAINNTLAPVRVPAFPELQFSGRIVCPIRIKGEAVGRVWIIEGDQPISDLALRAAEHAAVIAALQISHQRALASLEARVGYSFLTALLEGRFDSTPHTLERARIQGFSPETVYRVGMFVMNEEVPLSTEGLLRRERLAERLRQQLLQLDVLPLISVQLNQIPFLLPEETDIQNLWTHLLQPNIAFLTSRAHCGVNGIRDAYQEVLAMLNYARWGMMQRYEDLLLPRVLMGEAEARTAFLNQTFGSLKQLRNGRVLVDTLVTFANNSFRLKQTAEVLHIHPKSLRYRLERIGEHLNIDFKDADTRFHLQLAAQILSLEDKKV